MINAVANPATSERLQELHYVPRKVSAIVAAQVFSSFCNVQLMGEVLNQECDMLQ